MIRRVLALLGAAAVTTLGLTACEPAAEYDVAFFGDVPYASGDGVRFDNMIRAINSSGTVFSGHLGDIGPAEPATCTNSWVDRETARYDTLQQPMVYTPGDNEWTDCGSSQQQTRLSYLRSRILRGTGSPSRGATTMALETQASRGYPENARWARGPVMFATLHIVGSRDNYSNQSEFAPRRRATLDWVAQTFDLARQQGKEGVVLLAQADPNLDQAASDSGATAYRSMYEAVTGQTRLFDGEVLFVHGDGHSFKNEKPMAGLSNLRRVQVEGDSRVSFVRVHVDPGAGANLFSVIKSQSF